MDGFTDTIPASGIHPSAVIHPRAEIGRDVRIGPFCTIGPDVVLEDGVTLISHVVVDGITRIGEGTTVYPFVSIGLPPQDVKYRNEPTRCEIGARTQIREHCSIHRGTPGGRGVTNVGDGCMLMAVVHVAHDCRIGNGVVIANNVVMGGHCRIDDYAVIGGSAALHQGVHIGRGAMIGGLLGIGGDVLPFAMVTGEREGWVAGLNIIGMKRRGFDRAAMHRLRAVFQRLFGAGAGVRSERIDSVREEYGDEPLVAEALEFIANQGKRGLQRAKFGPEADED
ncbi:MAG TPA: acyl-ACP--UDP-N-acetylglucosamine O-acyltransferase [Acidisphaera sp.]|nr:acyl-ACP--UDP-N-acetylglucosamine O-acyltransferase [Acidisphaera sp.]